MIGPRWSRILAYYIIEVFFELHQAQIEKFLTASVESSLNAVLKGLPIKDPFANSGDEIKLLFDDFLTLLEMEKLGIPGVPTEAALKGVNHSFAHPYAKANPRRPSFVDTGTYRDNFKAWVD